MRVEINDNCIMCGLCSVSCPEVFSSDGDHIQVSPGGNCEEDLESIADECPAGAIDIYTDD